MNYGTLSNLFYTIISFDKILGTLKYQAFKKINYPISLKVQR